MTYIATAHILVYLDLIAPQYVGRQLVRCARTLMYPVNDGQHVFQNVYYVRLEKTRFHTITAELLTVEGKRVHFAEQDALDVGPTFSAPLPVVTPRENRI